MATTRARLKELRRALAEWFAGEGFRGSFDVAGKTVAARTTALTPRRRRP